MSKSEYCLELSKIFMYFESSEMSGIYQLDLITGDIVDENESAALIHDKNRCGYEFTAIPQVPFKIIAREFIRSYNNTQLMSAFLKSCETYQAVMRYFDSSGLKVEFDEFEKTFLIKYAKEWCSDNSIPFTVKEIPQIDIDEGIYQAVKRISAEIDRESKRIKSETDKKKRTS